MDNIRNLVRKLNSKELEVIRNYIKGFASRASEEEKKTLKLMQFILKDDGNFSEEEYSKHIYNSARDYRIDKLKSRLKSKIFDSLTLNINIDRRNAFDHHDNATLKTFKKLLTAKYMNFSSLEHSYTIKLLNEIIDLAKRFENYQALIEALILRKRASGFFEGINNFSEINSEIEYYQKKSLFLMKIEDLYYRKAIHSGFNAGCSEEILKIIKSGYAEMGSQLPEFASPLSYYYFKAIQYFIAMLENDFVLAHKLASELIANIPSEQSVNRKARLGAAHHYLAEANLYIGNFETSIENCEKGCSYFNPKSTNFILSKEYEFYSWFHSGNYKKAKNLINFLTELYIDEVGSFRASKYQFLAASLLFTQKDFMGAYRLLRKHMEISKDKAGWDLGVRILTIQCCIELNFDKEASKFIELLKKQFRNKNIAPGIRNRNHVILQILISLDKKALDFRRTYPQVLDLLDQLNKTNSGMNRLMIGPELVCFRSWFLSRARPN